MFETPFTIIGIDPGMTNTAFSVVTVTKTGLLRLKSLEVRTLKKDNHTNKEKYCLLRGHLKRLIVQNKPVAVVCEAFEVRSWGKPMKSGYAMSLLINELSSETFENQTLFLLSSPSIKQHYSMETLSPAVRQKVEALALTRQGHAFDSYIHVHHLFNKGGKYGRA